MAMLSDSYIRLSLVCYLICLNIDFDYCFHCLLDLVTCNITLIKFVMSHNTCEPLLSGFWPVLDSHNHSHHLYNFRDSQKPSSMLELGHYQLLTLNIIYSKVLSLVLL